MRRHWATMRLAFLLLIFIVFEGGSIGNWTLGNHLTSGEGSSLIRHRIRKRNPTQTHKLIDHEAPASLSVDASRGRISHPSKIPFGMGSAAYHPRFMFDQNLSRGLITNRPCNELKEQETINFWADKSAPPDHIPVTADDDDTGNDLQDPASKRKPTSKTDFQSRNEEQTISSQQSTESTTEIPSIEDFKRISNVINVNISGKCLENIAYSVCYGQGLTASQEVLIDAAYDTPFECINCTISKIQLLYCEPCDPQADPAKRSDSSSERSYPNCLPNTLHGRKSPVNFPVSGGGNYNYLCAKFHQRGVFEDVGKDAGWPCERHLRCLCGEFCGSGPKPKNKTRTLKQELENSFNLLNRQRQGSKDVKFYIAKSTDKNYSMKK